MTPNSHFAASIEEISVRTGMLRALFGRLMPELRTGRLEIAFPSQARVVRGSLRGAPAASIDVRRWRALWRLALGGDIGFAESYANGDWSTPDLAALMQLAMLNEDVLASCTRGSWPVRVLDRLRHHSRRNSRRGSLRNIAGHYDLGNDFYAAWLDRGMNYSSALYQGDDMTLEGAQDAKFARVTKLLGIEGGESVLEIGCGWGSLAGRLARRHGCKVIGITLSAEQFAFASAQLTDLIAVGRADLRLQDYREVDGRFDRVVSIEMMEAVGEKYWPTYFEVIRDRLRKSGTAVLQVISIAEDRFPAYRKRPDFIQRHIFPGGMLPTPSLIHAQAERAGLIVVSCESFGESYARTLAEWRRRLLRSWPRLVAMGFNERLCRLWDYYLAYCETGFRCQVTDVALYKLLRQ